MKIAQTPINYRKELKIHLVLMMTLKQVSTLLLSDHNNISFITEVQLIHLVECADIVSYLNFGKCKGQLKFLFFLCFLPFVSLFQYLYCTVPAVYRVSVGPFKISPINSSSFFSFSSAIASFCLLYLLSWIYFNVNLRQYLSSKTFKLEVT